MFPVGAIKTLEEIESILGSEYLFLAEPEVMHILYKPFEIQEFEFIHSVSVLRSFIILSGHNRITFRPWGFSINHLLDTKKIAFLFDEEFYAKFYAHIGLMGEE